MEDFDWSKAFLVIILRESSEDLLIITTILESYMYYYFFQNGWTQNFGPVNPSAGPVSGCPRNLQTKRNRQMAVI